MRLLRFLHIAIAVVLVMVTYNSCSTTKQTKIPKDVIQNADNKDSDGDGIKDNIDQEMNTVPGCPVDAAGRSLDTDHDGLIDCKDAEINSPLGFKVDGRGVAIRDTDGDGINDPDDKCPTIAGSLQNYGCPAIGSSGSPGDTSKMGSGGTGYGSSGVKWNRHEEDTVYPTKQGTPISTIEKKNEGKPNEADNKENASIAYGCKRQVKVGQSIDMRVRVEMLSNEEQTKSNLKKMMPPTVKVNEADTNVIKTLNTAGADSLKIELKYDTGIFEIKWLNPDAQALIYRPNTSTDWLWKVKGKHPTGNDDQSIDFIVYAKNIDGQWEKRDIQPMYLKVEVAAEIPKNVTPNVKVDSSSSPWLWVVVGAGLLALLGGVGFYFLRKKTPVAAAKKMAVYFSYAWDQQEQLVDRLYNSLKRDGFNVVRDKQDLGYKGTISDFMSEIGNANYVIVALSDKYLKSRFCMFELYEIYKNVGMDKAKFIERIFPLRVENINLNDTDVVNGYVNYWETEKARWDINMKENSDNVTPEQTNQYQVVKRLVNELTALLQILSDINALNIESLEKDDFEEIKIALRKELM